MMRMKRKRKKRRTSLTIVLTSPLLKVYSPLFRTTLNVLVMRMMSGPSSIWLT
ncbi:hypothetical protein D3C79_956490 [compost metagenome]